MYGTLGFDFLHPGLWMCGTFICQGALCSKCWSNLRTTHFLTLEESSTHGTSEISDQLLVAISTAFELQSHSLLRLNSFPMAICIAFVIRGREIQLLYRIRYSSWSREEVSWCGSLEFACCC